VTVALVETQLVGSELYHHGIKIFLHLEVSSVEFSIRNGWLKVIGSLRFIGTSSGKQNSQN